MCSFHCNKAWICQRTTRLLRTKVVRRSTSFIASVTAYGCYQRCGRVCAGVELWPVTDAQAATQGPHCRAASLSDISRTKTCAQFSQVLDRLTLSRSIPHQGRLQCHFSRKATLFYAQPYTFVVASRSIASMIYSCCVGSYLVRGGSGGTGSAVNTRERGLREGTW